MQPDSRPVSHSDESAPGPMNASYWKRMLFIQRWRRITWLVCLLLALWALLFLQLDSGSQHPPTVMIVKSTFAFIVAAIAAVNFFTVRLRK